MTTIPSAHRGANARMLDVASLDSADAAQELVGHAARIGASDLFFLSNESFMAVQVRHLGLVRPLSVVGIDQGRKLIAHIKALAGMDVGEHRRPLDGRWIFEPEEDGEPSVDLRISVIPTMHGEDMAIRLLVRQSKLFSLDSLGLIHEQLQLVQAMLESPGGMILTTGPTGSGKTATLYACLAALNDGSRKINTIEDPVEYAVDGLRQSQINPPLGLTFATLLRSVLRQGPDVIMIGEIRDTETAETAVRAANSGHLVFSTLHAPVATGAVQSLRSLGVHPHFLSTALRGVIAQRLARSLCPKCRIEFDISHAPSTFDEVRPWLMASEGKTLFAPRGCDACGMSGYASRTGVFEVLDVNQELRALISDDRPTRELRSHAIETGMLEFRKAALLKVARGITSTEEVFRVIPSEHLLTEG